MFTDPPSASEENVEFLDNLHKHYVGVTENSSLESTSGGVVVAGDTEVGSDQSMSNRTLNIVELLFAPFMKVISVNMKRWERETY